LRRANSKSVFINCPFTDDYSDIFRAIVFTVADCGFEPRSALEVDDSGDIRIQKIESLIEQSKFGIHDISNMKLDPQSNLPRFNMPLELGIFMGAKRFGGEEQKRKRLLVLDQERYRYQKAISDISGQDIKSHGGEPAKAIKCIRDWLKGVSRRTTIPGATHIAKRYKQYEEALPSICDKLSYEVDELTFNDMWETMVIWQDETDR